MNRLLKRYATLCLMALAAACSEDPADQGGTPSGGKARIRLELAAQPQTGTRAGWTDPDAQNEEMLKNALVIMAKDGNVEKIIPLETDANWYERRTVTTIADNGGTYTFYSFGNIDYTTEAEGGVNYTTVNGLRFAEGHPLPAGLETATYTADFNKYAPSATRPIPMSNKETATVSSTTTTELHLFRMLSKVKFRFSNSTDKDITIQKVEMGEISDNGTSIYLLPPTNAEGVTNKFPEQKVTNGTLTVFDGALDVPEGTTKENPKECLAYFNESVSQHATGQIPVTITLLREGGTDPDDVETRHTLMNLSTIPRNTYVMVPIALTDYEMQLKASAYAPIGGYPPYKMEEKENDFYCTFSAGGDFALRPFIYKVEDKKNEANWFELTDKSKVDSYTIKVEGNKDIFTEGKEPQALTGGELLGTLSGTPGTATVKLTANIITGTSPLVTQVYTRTIYIIVNKKL